TPGCWRSGLTGLGKRFTKDECNKSPSGVKTLERSRQRISRRLQAHWRASSFSIRVYGPWAASGRGDVERPSAVHSRTTAGTRLTAEGLLFIMDRKKNVYPISPLLSHTEPPVRRHPPLSLGCWTCLAVVLLCTSMSPG